MELVDAHHHLWDRGRFRYRWLSQVPDLDRDCLLRDYEAAIAGTGVVSSVHVQADVDETFGLQETKWILSLADAGGPIRAVVGWVPVERPDLAGFLDQLGEHPRLKGFRRLIQGEPDSGFAARPGFVAGVRTLGQRGYSFDVCVHHHQLPAVLELARRVEGTLLVLDHIGKPAIRDGVLEPWRSHIRQLAAMDHVYCKLSGMATEADWRAWSVADLRPYAETVLEAFGCDRVMFGSDWPVSTLAVGYARWLDTARELAAGATDAERRALFCGTASRFYRLP